MSKNPLNGKRQVSNRLKTKKQRLSAAAPTDFDWFTQLKDDPHSEINFWTPTPWNIRQLVKGDKFYFLLKSPIRKIGGLGYFSYYENMATEEAWNKFGKANGVSSLAELIARTSKLANRRSFNFDSASSYQIGCIVLTNPVFFEEEDYFLPEKLGAPFGKEAVKHKYFTATETSEIERILADKVPFPAERSPFNLVGGGQVEYRSSKRKYRKGQSQFRQKVLAAYGYKCAITGETCDEILEAAHIEGYINEESNHIQNGLALRVDFHELYDAGLINVDIDYRVRVSPFLTSHSYKSYENKEICLPSNQSLHPSKEALGYHTKERFRRSK